MEPNLILILFIFLVVVVVIIAVVKVPWSRITTGGWWPRCSIPALYQMLDGDLRTRQEELVREIFQCLTGRPFPPANNGGPNVDHRISYIKYDPRRKKIKPTLLEVDGKCDELMVSFEYHGAHHYDPSLFSSPSDFMKRLSNDATKRDILRSLGYRHIEIPSTVCGIGNEQDPVSRHECILRLISHIQSELLRAGVPMIAQYPIFPVSYPHPPKEYTVVVSKDNKGHHLQPTRIIHDATNTTYDLDPRDRTYKSKVA